MTRTTTQSDVRAARDKLAAEFPAWSIIVTQPNKRLVAFRLPEFDDHGRLIHHDVTDLEASTPSELRALIRKASS